MQVSKTGIHGAEPCGRRLHCQESRIPSRQPAVKLTGRAKGRSMRGSYSHTSPLALPNNQHCHSHMMPISTSLDTRYSIFRRHSHQQDIHLNAEQSISGGDRALIAGPQAASSGSQGQKEWQFQRETSQRRQRPARQNPESPSKGNDSFSKGSQNPADAMTHRQSLEAAQPPAPPHASWQDQEPNVRNRSRDRAESRAEGRQAVDRNRKPQQAIQKTSRAEEDIWNSPPDPRGNPTDTGQPNNRRFKPQQPSGTYNDKGSHSTWPRVSRSRAEENWNAQYGQPEDRGSYADRDWSSGNGRESMNRTWDEARPFNAPSSMDSRGGFSRPSKEYQPANEAAPWRGMRDGEDSAELDRKARVRMTIACNKILMTAYEQFCVEEQKATRIADRQDALQAYFNKAEDTVSGNETSMDPINISVALQKLAAASSAVSPVGESLQSLKRIFWKIIGLALDLQSQFKIDAINITLGALARFLALGKSSPLPAAETQEAYDIQVLLDGFAVKAFNRVSEPPAPEAHQLSLLVWGYSRLSLDPLDGRLFTLVQQKASTMISRFDFQNISNFMLAAATLGKTLSEEFLEAMARQAVLKMSQATPQGIANLLWAFARLTDVSPMNGDLFRSALSRASEAGSPPSAETLPFEDMRVTLRGISPALKVINALFRQARHPSADGEPPSLNSSPKTLGYTCCLQLIEQFSTQNVANSFWAAVRFEYQLTPRMLNRLANAALKKIEGAHPVAIAGLLTSYSKMEGVSGKEPLFQASIQEVDGMLDQCNAQTLSNLIWTLGSMKVELPSPLLHRLDKAWAERILAVLDEVWGQNSGWAQNVSNILWGYSQLRLDPLQGRLFHDILSRLDKSHFKVLLPGHTSGILLAAATMQRRSFSPDFLNNALSQIISKGGSKEICNTMWSLSALGLLRRAAMQSLVNRLLELLEEEPLHEFSARQLLMAETLLLVQDKGQQSSGTVPDQLLETCKVLLKETRKAAVISGFHNDVSAALEKMGVPHAIEFSSPDGLLSIDIVARCGDGKPLAIEVDGAEHFTCLPPYRPLGHTAIRNQMIASQGFRGVGIPFYDWNSLSKQAEKLSYVSARLAKWGITSYDAPQEAVR